MQRFERRFRRRVEGTRCRDTSPGTRTSILRRALTLVELLVVIAIIGTLVSLLMPAIQMVRESARRTACMNHQRQIGIALQAHHAAHQAFPVGTVEWRRSSDLSQRQLAWSVYLLPFLEQQNVFDQLDLNFAFDAPENAEGAAQIIPVFICPSSLRGTQRVRGRGPSDYGGIFGERITSRNDPPKGTLIHDRAIRFRDITDGSSNTLIVSEDTGWQDGQWIDGRNVFDQAFPINAAPPFENDIRSEHPAGAVGTFCDGSVRFLSQSIDPIPLAAICTRAGGETDLP